MTDQPSSQDADTAPIDVRSTAAPGTPNRPVRKCCLLHPFGLKDAQRLRGRMGDTSARQDAFNPRCDVFNLFIINELNAERVGF